MQTFLRDTQQKTKRQQSQAAARKILIGNMQKSYLSGTIITKTGAKGAVQSPPPEIFKTWQGLEHPELILKLALL